MAEILVKATNEIGYKRGMPVVIMPDGHPWGLEERLPKFVVLKIPLIGVAQVAKYIVPQFLAGELIRKRRWQIRWDDLPAQDRNKLATEGELIIKATAAYLGPFDRTWAQVKSFFRNLETGLDETADL